eukprot:GEZU01024597.1.p2 GENE.GEZU01024597.1~~GEZU01024597.1.p2  ORF type:complete len:145 (+),score=65.69 GEZU01024597.1:355-789(+)
MRIECIKKIRESAIGDTLKIWDENGHEVCFATHQELRDYYFNEVLAQTTTTNKKKKAPEVREELEVVLKSTERVFMMRFLAGRPEYEVRQPIFKRGRSNNNSNSSKNRFEEEEEEDDEDEENEEEEEEECNIDSGSMQGTGALV